MKIKLENLALNCALEIDSQRLRKRRWLACFLSMAAVLLLVFAVSPQFFSQDGGNKELVQHRIDLSDQDIEITVQSPNPVSFDTLTSLHDQINRHEVYALSSELPGLGSFKALSICLDWIQKSVLRIQEKEPMLPEEKENLEHSQSMRIDDHRWLALAA